MITTSSTTLDFNSPKVDTSSVAARKQKRRRRSSENTQSSSNQSINWKEIATPDRPPRKRRNAADNPNYHHAEEWEAFRSVIEDLYMENDLEKVVSIMAKKHRFKASIAQYKAKLSKWGVNKYLKLSSKQILYMIRETVRRSPKTATAFRLNGKRLNSHNLQRILRRKMEEDQFKEASLVSAMSSCGLSAYTPSSTNGIKIPGFSHSRVATPSNKSSKAAEKLVLQLGAHNDNVKLAGKPPAGLLFVKYPLKYDHLHTLQFVSREQLLDLAVHLVESEHLPEHVPVYTGAGGGTYSRVVSLPPLAGSRLPEQVKCILLLLHLIYPDGNGPQRFKALAHLTEPTSLDYVPSVNYEIHCEDCSYSHTLPEIASLGIETPINEQAWARDYIRQFAQDFVDGHQNYIDNETIVEELSEYYGVDFGIEWQKQPPAVGLEQPQNMMGEYLDSITAGMDDTWWKQVEDAHDDEDSMSLSDLCRPELWESPV